MEQNRKRKYDLEGTGYSETFFKLRLVHLIWYCLLQFDPITSYAGLISQSTLLPVEMWNIRAALMTHMILISLFRI